MSYIKKLFYGGVYNFFTNICINFLNFLLIILLARLLGPQKFGLYSFLISWLGMSVIVLEFGLSTTISKYISEYYSRKAFEDIKILLSSATKIFLINIIILSSLIFIFYFTLEKYVLEISFKLLIVLFVLAILESMFQIILSLLRGIYHWKNYAISSVVKGTLRFGAMGLIAYFYKDVYLLFMVFLLSTSFAILFSIFQNKNFLDKHFSFQLKLKIPKEIFNFSVFSFLRIISAVIFQTSDSLLLGFMRPIEEVGYYRVALTLVYILGLINPLSETLLLPLFCSFQGKEDLGNYFAYSIKYLTIFASFVIFSLLATSHVFIPALYGMEYAASSTIFNILIFMGFDLLMGGVISASLLGKGKVKVAAEITGIMSLLNIGLNIYLIPLYGAKGAAFSTISTRLLGMFSGGVIVVKMIGMRISISNLLTPLLLGVSVFIVLHYINITSIPLAILWISLSFFLYLVGLFVTKTISKTELKYLYSSIK